MHAVIDERLRASYSRYRRCFHWLPLLLWNAGGTGLTPERRKPFMRLVVRMVMPAVWVSCRITFGLV